MSSAQLKRFYTERRYNMAAREYLRSLKPEDFMEGTLSATQRKITVESFDLVTARRPDVQMFNELLIQYPDEETDAILRIIPDNMVLVHPEPLGELLSFNYPTQEARPFWVFEYFSAGSERKDTEVNHAIYEQSLRVPYYLIFYPDTRDLTLFRLNKKHRYMTVKPAANGRYAVPELDMEVAILDGWVRYWYAGELLQLPADLEGELTRERQLRIQAEQRVVSLEAELARLRAQLGEAPGQGTT